MVVEGTDDITFLIKAECRSFNTFQKPNAVRRIIRGIKSGDGLQLSLHVETTLAPDDSIYGLQIILKMFGTFVAILTF